MRGSLKHRKGRSWTLVIDLGKETDPETGLLRRKQKFITLKDATNRTAAEAQQTEIMRSLNHAEFVAPSKLTVGDWLTWWAKDLDTGSTARQTRARYRGIVTQIRAAAIAATPLQRLLPMQLDQYYADLSTTLQPATVQLHHTVIHSALGVARVNNLVGRNVANDCKKRPKADKSQGAKAHCWTAAEVQAFLAVADAAGAQPSAFYALAIDTGARLRELAGLTWGDVDLEAGRVHIHRQLCPGAALAPAWGPTKTKEDRTVSLMSETVARLRTHKQQQAELKMKHRKQYQDFGLIFAKEHSHVRRGKDSLGQPLQVNNINEREFGRLSAAAGVPRIKFHGLRHTSATLQLLNGEALLNVAARLGHSKTSITLDVYGHALKDQGPTVLQKVIYG